MKPSGI